MRSAFRAACPGDILRRPARRSRGQVPQVPDDRLAIDRLAIHPLAIHPLAIYRPRSPK